jgi:hypothetical protein
MWVIMLKKYSVAIFAVSCLASCSQTVRPSAGSFESEAGSGTLVAISTGGLIGSARVSAYNPFRGSGGNRVAPYDPENAGSIPGLPRNAFVNALASIHPQVPPAQQPPAAIEAPPQVPSNLDWATQYWQMQYEHVPAQLVEDPQNDINPFGPSRANLPPCARPRGNLLMGGIHAQNACDDELGEPLDEEAAGEIADADELADTTLAGVEATEFAETTMIATATDVAASTEELIGMAVLEALEEL